MIYRRQRLADEDNSRGNNIKFDVVSYIEFEKHTKESTRYARRTRAYQVKNSINKKIKIVKPIEFQNYFKKKKLTIKVFDSIP